MTTTFSNRPNIMNLIKKYCIPLNLILGITLSQSGVVNAQSSASDSSSATHDTHTPVYHVNYWISGGIIAAGAIAGFTLPQRAKSNLDSADLANLNQSNVPFFDRISLHQNPALVPTFDNYSTILQYTMAALPLTLLIDNDIRQDWLPVMVMGLEVNMVAVGIYGVSPLGPLLISRYRPVTYYPNAPVNRLDGNQKNSFYSGHTASAAAASYFMAKVYCDYHPDANEYLVYGAATIPPLVMGYVRFMSLNHFPSDIAAGYAVGTLCGVLIPELHKIGDKNLSMGAYSSPTSTGLTLTWDMASK
jgi:membrane-associated phospholipid phosphatase